MQLTANWFLPSGASLKRTLIQRIILELIENRYGEVCLLACSDGDQAKYRGCNQLEIGAEFLSGRSSPTIACPENISESQEDHKIKRLYYPHLHLGVLSVLVMQAWFSGNAFQSGEAAGSLFGQYQSFENK